MDRRSFLLSSLAFLAASSIPENLSAKSMAKKKSRTPKRIKNLPELIKRLKKHDILHFGEVHRTRNWKEPSTLDDLVDFFLPEFNESHPVLRTEFLAYEFGPYGTQLITQEELDNFDSDGYLTRSFVNASYNTLEPEGAIRLAKEAHAMGYHVRGFGLDDMTTNALQSIAKSSDDLFMKAITRIDVNLVESFEHDPREKAVLYSGALHNNVYAAMELRKKFGDKYVSIDLIKPSTTEIEAVTDYDHFLEPYKQSVKTLNKLMIFEGNKMKDADYVIFLPERSKWRK